MLKRYILNFWLWWYGAKFKGVLQAAYSFWSLSLANLNILPMLANLFVPMYQDKSLTGKFLSFILRSVWVFFGSILQLLITIPLILLVILWVGLPLVGIAQVVRFFI